MELTPNLLSKNFIGILKLVLILSLLYNLKFLGVSALPALDAELRSPSLTGYKNIDDQIIFEFKVIQRGTNKGISNAESTLYIDNKEIETQKSSPSGRLVFSYDFTETDPIKVKLEMNKKGHINSSREWNINNFYKLTTLPSDESVITYKELRISTIFKMNGNAVEHANIEVYYNGEQYPVELFPNGAGSVKISQPKYGENEYYVIGQIDDLEIRTQSYQFTYLKELSVSLFSIDYDVLQNYTDPIINLKAITYSFQEKTPGINIDFYIDGSNVYTTQTNSEGVASYSYKADIDEVVEYYVVAHRDGFETKKSITRDINILKNKPSLLCNVIYPTEATIVESHEKEIEFIIEVLKNDEPERGAVIDFFVNNKKSGSSITDSLGKAVYHYLPSIENNTYQWKFKVTSIQNLTYISDVYSFSTPLQAPDVIVPNVYVSDKRTSVGNTVTIGFVLVWENGTRLNNSLVSIGEQLARTNSEGLVYFNVSSNKVQKNTYEITDILSEDYYKIRHYEIPEIVWDKVIFNLSTFRERVNIGSNAEIETEGYYQYDKSEFEGINIYNEELNQTVPCKKVIYISDIKDDLYGIDYFESNKVSIIWDFVNVTIMDPQRRQMLGCEYNPIFNAYYAYDGKEFDGAVSFSDFDKYKTGDYILEAVEIKDKKYHLDKYSSNKVKLKYDNINLDKKIISKSPGKINITYIAIYESDLSPVNGLNISINNVTLNEIDTGIYSITLNSFSPSLTLKENVLYHSSLITSKSIKFYHNYNIITLCSTVLIISGGTYYIYYEREKENAIYLILTELKNKTMFKRDIININYQEIVHKRIKDKTHIYSKYNNKYLSINYLQNIYKIKDIKEIYSKLSLKSINTNSFVTSKHKNIKINSRQIQKNPFNKIIKTKINLYSNKAIKIKYIEIYKNFNRELDINNKTNCLILQDIYKLNYSNNKVIKFYPKIHINNLVNKSILEPQINTLKPNVEPVNASKNKITSLSTKIIINKLDHKLLLKPKLLSIKEKTRKTGLFLLDNTPDSEIPTNNSLETIALMAPELFPPLKDYDEIEPDVYLIKNQAINNSSEEKQDKIEEKKENFSKNREDKKSLIDLLISEDIKTRNQARNQIVEVGASLIPDLIIAFNETESLYKWKIIQVLGYIGTRDTIPFLNTLVSHPNKRIRLFAEQSIKKIEKRNTRF